jgi:hypothetical protein
MSRYDSPIVRLTTGFIDNINDTVIGGKPAFGSSLTQSMLAGQLGQGFWLDDTDILWNSATPGYGGHFRYVLLSAASSAVVRGQCVFWDVITAPNTAGNMTVTTLETGSTDGGMQMAGIVLNSGWAAGKYSVIQDIGITYVKFRAVLTAAGALGSRVFEAAAGAGADNGLFDVVDSGAAPTFADISKMTGRFLGIAQEAPAGGGLKRVDIFIRNIRG